jgi:hypothetical protein
MARGQFAWSPVKPVEVSKELAAQFSAVEGLGDIYENIGNTFDKALTDKKERDTADFLSLARQQATVAERNALLEKERNKAFSFLDMPQVNKDLQALELHDFARNQEDRNIAAADLLQKEYAADIENEKTRALEAQQKHSLATEIFLGEEAGREAEQNRFKIEQAFKEDKVKFEKKKYDDLKENRELTLGGLQRKDEKEQIAADHYDAVQDSLGVVASIKNDPRTWFDKNGAPISGDEAVLRQLETSIMQGKDAGISETDLAPLINQYKGFLDNDTLVDDNGLYVTQADINKAFPKTKKINYTPAGRLRLENAVRKRLQSKYKVKTDTIATKFKEMAKTAVSSSAYAQNFTNPLINADKAMEQAINKKVPSIVKTVEGKKVVNEPATIKKQNKQIISTYLRELKKLQTYNSSDDVNLFNQRHRQGALDAVDLDLNIMSTTKTKFVGGEGSGYEDSYDPKKSKKQRIINKPASQITVDDITRYNRNLMEQVKKGGFRNITQAEFDQIKAKNEDIAGGGISAKFTKARKLIGYNVEIADTVDKSAVTEEKALPEAKARLAKETADMHALVEVEGISQGVKPSYVKWLKDNNYDIPKPEAINNAVLRLESILNKKMGGTATKFEKADLIINFLRSTAAGTDASGSTTEVIYDSNEDKFVNEGWNWPIISQLFGATSDQEITDAPDSANTQLFRMMLEESAKRSGKFESIIDKEKVKTNKQTIKEATAELLKYGVSRKDNGYTKPNTGKSLFREALKEINPFTDDLRNSSDTIKMLKNSIKKAEEENTKLQNKKSN